MTIGDLLASLPQPNTFTLGDCFLLVLGSPTASQGLSFERINLFDTGLPQFATGGSTVGYRAQFTVAANGGPTRRAGPVTRHVDARARLPLRGRQLEARAGSGNCATVAPPIADPVVDDAERRPAQAHVDGQHDRRQQLRGLLHGAAGHRARPAGGLARRRSLAAARRRCDRDAAQRRRHDRAERRRRRTAPHDLRTTPSTSRT